MDYTLNRSEKEEICSKKYWTLVYGRRKVGKTFLLKNLCSFKTYYTIKKNLEILHNNAAISLPDFIREVKENIINNNPVVIDEFQRLDEGTLEELSILHPKGRVILSGSSLRIIKKIFEPKSPLLGFFTPQKVGFVKPSDMIKGLKGKLDSEILVEVGAFLREPWLIPIYGMEEILKFIYNVTVNSKYTITALVGEIFTEEERELTKTYSALLSLIGSGIWGAKELASIMYSRKLIKEASPSQIIQYIKNLEEMELVESIKLYKSRKFFYRLKSPIMNVFYYLDDRYDISRRDMSFEEVKPTLQNLINIEIQNFIADIFAEKYNGRKEYYIYKDKEIDFIITKRNKLEIVGEVKWKKIEKSDIEKFKKNTKNFQGKKILICKKGKLVDKEIEVMNAAELLNEN